jgi:hypothetical protein
MGTPTEGAGLKCHVCGARPFAAAFGLPPDLESFDLVKVGDKWGCPRHRPARPKSGRSGSKSEVLDELAETIANLDADIAEDILGEKFAQVDEKGLEKALKLIASIRAKLKLKPASP